MYAFVYQSVVLIFTQFVEVVRFVRWDKDVMSSLVFLGPKDGEFFLQARCAHFIIWCEWLHFFTISHLMLKLMFLAFNFQTLSLSVVEVLLCSNLKDDLCKLNLVLKLFSVSSIHVSWLFVGVSVTAALYTTHLARHSLFSRHEVFFFCRQIQSLLSRVGSFILCGCR